MSILSFSGSRSQSPGAPSSVAGDIELQIQIKLGYMYKYDVSYGNAYKYLYILITKLIFAMI